MANHNKTKLDLQEIRKDGIIAVCAWIALLIIIKIIFRNETWMNILKITGALVWLFILPGLIISYIFPGTVRKAERILMGIGIAAATLGIATYYFNMIGMNINSLGFMPIIIIIGAGIILFMQTRKR